MSLLSSWVEMDVCVGLLAGDEWAAEDDKIGSLSVEVDILINYIWKNDEFPCSWCK